MRQGEDLPEAVAAALELREPNVIKSRTGAAQAPPTDRIAAHLGGRSCLLVLDNCEHLVEEAARSVQTLLARCPGLRVLATSREPLGLSGETLLPVPSLDLPPEGSEPFPTPLFLGATPTEPRAGSDPASVREGR